MKNIDDLADLIRDSGGAFYGSETPEYMASRWVKALPKAGLPDFHEWLYRGFWSPDVAKALSDAGIFPWEVPSGTAYDLCSGDLPVAVFLRARRY